MKGLVESFDKIEDPDATLLDYINEKISFSDLMLLLLNNLDEYDEGKIGEEEW